MSRCRTLALLRAVLKQKYSVTLQLLPLILFFIFIFCKNPNESIKCKNSHVVLPAVIHTAHLQHNKHSLIRSCGSGSVTRPPVDFCFVLPCVRGSESAAVYDREPLEPRDTEIAGVRVGPSRTARFSRARCCCSGSGSPPFRYARGIPGDLMLTSPSALSLDH